MEPGFEKKVAFVAGSTQGIGKAIARAFLEEGCRVVVSGRGESRLEEAASEFGGEFGDDRVLPFCGDLTRPDDVQKAVRETVNRWGAIDFLVANVGSGRAKPGWEVSEDDWQGVFEHNLWGSVRLVREALPHMVEAGRGSVVFISSIAGYESIGAPITYGTAKAALHHYFKDLARQVGQHGVRVNCVAPGNVLFPGGSWEKKLEERRDSIMDYVRREVALQRFGRPEEIAGVVVFLCSERASFVTGACIVADGGQTRSY